MIKKILTLIISIGTTIAVNAQVENLSNSTKPLHDKEPPVDGYVVKSDVENRKVIPYAPIRQTDVAFSKRVWREIDLRQKMNQAFSSPKARLMDIIIDAIQKGELTAYDPTPTKNDPNGDSFKNILPIDQVMARLGGDSVLVEQYNESNEVVGSHYEKRDWSGESVLKFRIKEDWIFDKQRAVFEPRIIGIAPLITPQIPGMDPVFEAQLPAAANADPFDPFAVQTEEPVANDQAQQPAVPAINNLGPQVDATPAFWIYFPEARHVFVNKEVVNRNSDATGLSYDDVFIKRLFSSYIIKQSNSEDLRIKDYIQDDLDRLLESERIKKALMDYEQDLWSY
jgi:hypothetical protein